MVVCGNVIVQFGRKVRKRRTHALRHRLLGSANLLWRTQDNGPRAVKKNVKDLLESQEPRLRNAIFTILYNRSLDPNSCSTTSFCIQAQSLGPDSVCTSHSVYKCSRRQNCD